MAGAAQIDEYTGSVPASPHEFVTLVDRSVDRAQRSLLQLQRPEGYWLAPLEANAQMNSEFIIFNRFMSVVDAALQTKLTRFLLDRQQPDGSWNIFSGGEGYASHTVEAFFALRLAGVRRDDPAMVAARRWILSKGGIESAGTLARFYLATLGQVP